MMIIDDNELYPVPDAIKDMEEIQVRVHSSSFHFRHRTITHVNSFQMVVQHMNLATLQAASSTSLDNVTYWINKEDSPLENEPFEYTKATTDLTNFMMVCT